MSVLSPEQCQRFATDGYLVLPSFVEGGTCTRMRAVIQEQLASGDGPVEYEAEVAYPGSPASVDAEGGRTVRRLLKAHGRAPLFAAWFDDARMMEALGQLLDGPVVQARAHHNCVMTKQPRFSSDTGWHQDVRYWAFTRPELISTWLALGPETPENGGLKVLPGTHRMQFAPERYDARLFLRSDLPENAALIEGAQYVRLSPGDVLLFHARLFHAASRNHTADTKYSVVATYRRTDNLPVPGSRSARD
ncbi:phytanoyl-CoA dioxygenase family protein [Corallococcus exiguus]|uniref:phytanoyl-CoA dioxygenase family protein n=1 Tax=Corallococcus exiguus TaxID=83462 RepID=UPI0014710825|nr:phytanoyl-CoA dioxygenase family protein [Corallococcus exiguus]NNC22116.1 phytanoyl-CoA dioxygenase family protein [Corallococcus exiguus]NRD59502.1 phytanoyl-CoA dioxygenase family protein [Corallococcus exiguus]NRD66487.1 phytanoyl-CoA dioxygenase family protein [Corallococcus exiguus]